MPARLCSTGPCRPKIYATASRLTRVGILPVSLLHAPPALLANHIHGGRQRPGKGRRNSLRPQARLPPCGSTPGPMCLPWRSIADKWWPRETRGRATSVRRRRDQRAPASLSITGRLGALRDLLALRMGAGHRGQRSPRPSSASGGRSRCTGGIRRRRRLVYRLPRAATLHRVPGNLGCRILSKGAVI